MLDLFDIDDESMQAMGMAMPSAIFSASALSSNSVCTHACYPDSEGIWSAPVLYAADIKSEQPKLFLIFSIKPAYKVSPIIARLQTSIYAPYKDDWQAIKGVQIEGVIIKLTTIKRRVLSHCIFHAFLKFQNH